MIDVVVNPMEVEDALETLRRYITVGNVEGAKEVILEYQTKLSSCHGQHIEDHQLCAMKTDEVGTALIPRETELENFIAVKTTGDGNCMFNAASLWLAGNELLSDVLRLLVAGELFLFSEYYVQTIKDRFLEIANKIPYSEATVFSTILTEAGEKEMTNSKNRLEAIRAEARDTCLQNNWNGMIQMLALPSVLRCPVFSVYPEANAGLRPIFHWKISPRIAEVHSNTLEQIQIMWSRDGSLDARPHALFQPNHFVPVVQSSVSSDDVLLAKKQTNEEDPPAKSKKQPGKRDISSFFKPGNVGTSTMAAKKNTKVEIQGLKRKNESETATSTKKTSRKFLVHWIDDFPWIIYDDEKGVIFCEYCQHFGSTTGKSEFVKGCRTFKRETLKKHSDSFAHIKSRDAFMAKQMAEEDTPIFKCFVKMSKKSDEEQRKDVAMKMNTAYLIAKEEIPFTKFPKLLDLQRKNGLQIGETYATDKKCAEMVSTIAKVYQNKLAETVNEHVKYMSIMIDGGEDAAGVENETIHCRIVENGHPVNRLVGHKAVEYAHAEGQY